MEKKNIYIYTLTGTGSGSSVPFTWLPSSLLDDPDYPPQSAGRLQTEFENPFPSPRLVVFNLHETEIGEA